MHLATTWRGMWRGGTFNVLRNCLRVIETNGTYQTTEIEEPQLGKRVPYPAVSLANGARIVRDIMSVIAYSYRTRDLVDLANTIGAHALDYAKIIEKLVANDLLQAITTDETSLAQLQGNTS